MTLWLFVGLLTAVALVWMILPVYRRKTTAPSRSEYDVNVYKDQLDELEKEAAVGRVNEADLQAAKVEIQRRMLAAAELASDAPKKPGGLGVKPIFFAALIAPVSAVFFYMQTGEPTVPNFPLAERTDVQPGQARVQASPHQGQDAAPLSDAIRQLEARMAQNPADIDGWILLARSYINEGNMAKAVDAYSRVMPLTNRHPMLLADYAEARFMLNNGQFTQQIFDDFVEARQKDATLPKPWFYIGLDKAMAGEFREAAQTWVDLQEIVTDNPQFDRMIQEQIDRAGRDGGFDVAQVTPSDAARRISEASRATGQAGAVAAPQQQAAAPEPPRGPSAEDVRAAQEMSDEDRQAFIRSMVQSLAERLEENPNDPQGWERLIRAYDVLGETEKAAEARAKLEALGTN